MYVKPGLLTSVNTQLSRSEFFTRHWFYLSSIQDFLLSFQLASSTIAFLKVL
ncbi:hypothetical protein BY457_1271 [Marinilabilia salmonicolor]|nr:hypothetical protein BY457_1271 [Marinilabilia salmonicolor]